MSFKRKIAWMKIKLNVEKLPHFYIMPCLNDCHGDILSEATKEQLFKRHGDDSNGTIKKRILLQQIRKAKKKSFPLFYELCLNGFGHGGDR